MGIEKEENYDEKSCGLVLYRETESGPKFLLLHYPSGHWDFPKGHVEESDPDEQATAARELEEETGIDDIEFIDGYREEITYSYMRHDTKKMSHKIVAYFLARTRMKIIKLSHEHQGYKWLGFHAAYNRTTHDNAKNLLKKALPFIPGIQI